MERSTLQFRWLAALALWTSLIGPVLMSPMNPGGTPDRADAAAGEDP